MHVLLIVFLAALVALAGARVAYADLSSVLLGKIASRATPYNRDGARLDDAAAAALTLAGQPPTSSSPIDGAPPLDGAPPPDQPLERTLTPTPPPPKEPTPRQEGLFHFGAVDGRLSSKSLKTWYTTGNTSIQTELGYDGKLRLQADRPCLGGNLRFGFADEQGKGALRLEFKRNF